MKTQFVTYSLSVRGWWWWNYSPKCNILYVRVFSPICLYIIFTCIFQHTTDAELFNYDLILLLFFFFYTYWSPTWYINHNWFLTSIKKIWWCKLYFFTIFRSGLEIVLPSMNCEGIWKCQLRVLKLKNVNSFNNWLDINVLM